MWDRILEREEFEQFSGCLDIVQGNGNIINNDFNFNITGSIETEIEIPESEISCKKKSSFLFIPVHQGSIDGAQDTCNKIEIDSIAPTIDDYADIVSFFSAIQTYPAFRRECWHGSRMLTWLPYAREVGEKEFLHVTDKSVFDVDIWQFLAKMFLRSIEKLLLLILDLLNK